MSRAIGDYVYKCTQGKSALEQVRYPDPTQPHRTSSASQSLTRSRPRTQHPTAATTSPQMVIALPEVRVVSLGPADEFVVLATDGIFDVLSSQVRALGTEGGGAAHDDASLAWLRAAWLGNALRCAGTQHASHVRQ